MAKKTNSPEALSQSGQEGILFPQKALSPCIFSRSTDVMLDKLFHYSLEKRLELIESIICSA
jgi:hypothetical protein